jgi:hypothetical protein
MSNSPEQRLRLLHQLSRRDQDTMWFSGHQAKAALDMIGDGWITVNGDHRVAITELGTAVLRTSEVNNKVHRLRRHRVLAWSAGLTALMLANICLQCVTEDDAHAWHHDHHQTGRQHVADAGH